jgi:hypothetical protein
MADLDTSFYPKAPQNSLIDTLSTVAGIKNLAEQNKLLQGQQKQQDISIDQAKVDLAHKHYEGLANLVGSIAQDPRAGTAEGPALIQQYAANAVKLGYVTPEAADAALSTMPQDPTQIPQWLQTMNTQILDGAQRFGQIYGTPTMINDGSRIVPATVSPITGVRPIGAPIEQTLSPETRADLVQTKDAQGRTVLVPKGNVLTQAGINPMTAQPQSAPTGQENRLIPATAAPSVESQPLPAAQTQNPLGGVVASPAPSELETLSRASAASTDKFNQDIAREGAFQQDILPLEKARDALVALGTTGTGPGTEQLNEVRSFLTSMGIISPTEELQNFDKARKYLVQYARGAGDVGTNDKLAAAFAGNPSLGISNAAAVDVVKTAISLRRFQNAQVRAFATTGDSPAEYNKWMTEFNSKQDPVAYGFDMMDGAQRQKYFKGLSAPEKTKFLSSLKTATELGVIAPPSAE